MFKFIKKPILKVKDKLRNIRTHKHKEFESYKKLTDYIKDTHKTLQKSRESSWKRLTNWFRDLYEPSFGRTIFLIVICFIFNTLSHTQTYIQGYLDSISIEFLRRPNPGLQISVVAIIATILFAMIIFIAESLRDGKSTDKGRALLRESYLYPLVVVTVCFSIFFVTEDLNTLTTLILFILAFACILSLGRIISLSLNNFSLDLAKKDLLISRLTKSIDMAVKERIGNNGLSSFLQRENVDNYISIYKRNNLRVVRSKKSGVISEVYLKNLKLFIDRLKDNKSKKLNKDSSLDVPGNIATNQLDNIELEVSSYKKKISKGDVLIRYPKSLFDPEIVELEYKLYEIEPEDTYTEQIESEMYSLSELLIEAIQNRSIYRVDYYTGLLIDLADCFTNYLKNIDSNYNYSSAIKERSNWTGEWKQIDWILEILNSVYLEAIKTGDIKIFSAVAKISIHIARDAIKSHEHYIFQKFLNQFLVVYLNVLKSGDKDLKDYFLNSYLRTLKEMIIFVLIPKLFSNRKKVQYDSFQHFLSYILIIFKDLLKQTIDKEDTKTLREILNYLKEIRQDLADEIEKDYRIKRHKDLTKSEKIIKKVIKQIDEIYFGLGSFAFANAKPKSFFDSVFEIVNEVKE